MKYLQKIYKQSQQVISCIKNSKYEKAYKKWNILRNYIIKILISEGIKYKTSAVDYYCRRHENSLGNDKEILLNQLEYCADRFLSWERVFRTDDLILMLLQSIRGN